MPEFAFFMQKVYADKKLGIDPNAEFQKPAELNNDPIYADQNFSNIVRQGEGNDFTEDQGNGDAGDYIDQNVPVESEFKKDQFKDKNDADKKVIGPINMADEFKKESVPVKEPASKDLPDKQPKALMEKPVDKKNLKATDDKSKKANFKTDKSNNDY